MPSERKTRRKLQREIDLISEGRLALTPDGQPDHEARIKIQRKLDSLRVQLESFETSRLIRKARHLGIEVPKHSTWWRDDNEDGSLPDYAVRHYLTETGKVGLAKLIKEEKRKNIEWWIKIVVPLITALVSLLGIILALVTVLRNSPPTR